MKHIELPIYNGLLKVNKCSSTDKEDIFCVYLYISYDIQQRNYVSKQHLYMRSKRKTVRLLVSDKVVALNLYMVTPWMLPCSFPWNIYDLDKKKEEDPTINTEATHESRTIPFVRKSLRSR